MPGRKGSEGYLNDLTHVDLFSGIGGFALAAGWAGFRTVAFCEIEPFCQEILRKNWPDVPIYNNIKNFKWGGTKPTLLTGGFPCQPFSIAGKRRGKEDDRDLWGYMFEVIKSLRPFWVLGENVANFARMELDRTLVDLESISYSCQAFIIPSCALGSKHRRDRTWVVARDDNQKERVFANSQSAMLSDSSRRQKIEKISSRQNREEMAEQSGGNNWWTIEPDVGRVVHGVSDELDRKKRTKALGNAIVPQVAYQIIKAIAEIENEQK